MADKHAAAATGAVVWAVVGGVVALSQVPRANEDAVVLVGLFSVLGPALALAASVAATRGALRPAGAMLAVSALATPTYFAYPLNLVVLAAGAWLLATGRRAAPDPDRARAT